MLIQKLQDSGLGYKFEEGRVAVMAFADDLVLISENEFEMKKLCEISEQFFDQRKLRTRNVSKSFQSRTGSGKELISR